MYRKILIPIEGSSGTNLALEHGIKLALQMNAQITLFHVIPALPPYVSAAGNRLDDTYKQIHAHLQITAEAMLKKISEKLADYDGLSWQTKCVWGNPAQEICREACEGAYDLIVMGGRSLKGKTKPLKSRMVDRICRQVSCSVLLVR